MSDTPNFVHDLVQMAKAADRVPQLEEQVSALQAGRRIDGDTIIYLNTRIIDLGNELLDAKAKITHITEERDSASFQVLVAEDKVSALRNAIRDCQTTLGDAIAAIGPVVEPAPLPNYSRAWLQDVPGWMSISYDQWLAYGGLSSRFFGNKPVEPTPMVPNVDAGSSTSVTVSPPSFPSANEEAASFHQSVEPWAGATQGESAVDPTRANADGENTHHSTAPCEPVALPATAASTEGISVSSFPTVPMLHGSPSQTAPSTFVEGTENATSGRVEDREQANPTSVPTHNSSDGSAEDLFVFNVENTSTEGVSVQPNPSVPSSSGAGSETAGEGVRDDASSLTMMEPS